MAGRLAIGLTMVSVESVPLADGDLRWVFPALEDVPQVMEALAAADADMRRLAAHLGVRPGWTGSGLEFARLPAVTDLGGFAETSDVSFVAGLMSGVPAGLRRDGGPPWEVSAEIAVRCDAVSDCGMHAIEKWPPSMRDSALEAAAALARAVRWLLDRGTAEPPRSWRDRDSLSGHS